MALGLYGQGVQAGPYAEIVQGTPEYYDEMDRKQMARIKSDRDLRLFELMQGQRSQREARADRRSDLEAERAYREKRDTVGDSRFEQGRGDKLSEMIAGRTYQRSRDERGDAVLDRQLNTADDRYSDQQKLILDQIGYARGRDTRNDSIQDKQLGWMEEDRGFAQEDRANDVGRMKNKFIAGQIRPMLDGGGSGNEDLIAKLLGVPTASDRDFSKRKQALEISKLERESDPNFISPATLRQERKEALKMMFAPAMQAAAQNPDPSVMQGLMMQFNNALMEVDGGKPLGVQAPQIPVDTSSAAVNKHFAGGDPVASVKRAIEGLVSQNPNDLKEFALQAGVLNKTKEQILREYARTKQAELVNFLQMDGVPPKMAQVAVQRVLQGAF